MKGQFLAHGPFEVVVAEERHREPHPRGQCTFRVRVRFPWMRSPDCGLKLDERVLQGIERDWQAQLANFILHLPPFQQTLAATRDLLDDVFR